MTNLQELAQQGAISPEAIMQQLAQDNPNLATVMQLMADQQSNDDIEDAEWAEDEQPQLDRVERLMEEIRTLQHMNRLLSQQAELTADALGACHCFGVDESCPDCHGEGAPGTYVPGRQHFEQLVMPVLMNLKQWRAQRAAQTKRPTSVDNEQMPSGADDVK